MAHWYRKKIADRRAQPQGKNDLKINAAIGMPKEESHSDFGTTSAVSSTHKCDNALSKRISVLANRKESSG